jgi:hypothetical protein
MEGGPLSDDSIIALLNSKFVALYANFDVSGFPEGIPAVEKKYRSLWRLNKLFKVGVATSAVIDSSGTRLLGESGGCSGLQWNTATNFRPDKFLAFLENALASGSH